MQTSKSAQAWDLEPVECAKAMAEAEKVLSELSLAGSGMRLSNPVRSSSVDEKPSEQSLLSAQLVEPRAAALSSLDRLCLDPELDFVIHDEGVIELTAAGFRRMVQAHSTGLDAVIVVDRREVLRLRAPMLAHDACAAGRKQASEGSRKCVDLIEAHVRRTQPVAELLKAEQSCEMALNMINKERERREIESLLPWHAAGTLDRRDAERIERALAEDGELAQRYELGCRLIKSTIQEQRRGRQRPGNFAPACRIGLRCA
jgi:hypothetical protein